MENWAQTEAWNWGFPTGREPQAQQLGSAWTSARRRVEGGAGHSRMEELGSEAWNWGFPIEIEVDSAWALGTWTSRWE
jgi:hypothetical protein